MGDVKTFDNILAIKLDHPVDRIIRQIKNLISTKQLKPGDRLGGGKDEWNSLLINLL